MGAQLIGTDSGWREMLGVAALPALALGFGAWALLPESPRWLLLRSDGPEAAATARTALRRLRGSAASAARLEEDVLAMETAAAASRAAAARDPGWSALVAPKVCHRLPCSCHPCFCASPMAGAICYSFASKRWVPAWRLPNYARLCALSAPRRMPALFMPGCRSWFFNRSRDNRPCSITPPTFSSVLVSPPLRRHVGCGNFLCICVACAAAPSLLGLHVSSPIAPCRRDCAADL